MQDSKAIVIGTGMGGLAIAIRLALKGYQVEVFEKNSYPGGKLSAFEKDGYRFDAGPSLFTQPQNVEELFALAGEPIDQYFSYQSVPIANKYFYENGKQVNAYTNAEDFAQEMKQQLNEDPKVVIKYLQQSKKLYENIGLLFLNYSLHRAKTWLNSRVFKALSTVKLPYHFQTLHNAHNK
jgi:phytoene dehydrogenase-like protein